MCGAGSFTWQSEFFGFLGGNVCIWVFYVEMSVVVPFRWQCVLCHLGSKVSCIFRWQCVLLHVQGRHVCCFKF